LAQQQHLALHWDLTHGPLAFAPTAHERWLFLDPTLPPSDERALDPRLVGRYALVLRGSGRSSLERVGGCGGCGAVELPRGDAPPLQLYSKSQ
jgi:hypothetical protein